MTSDFEDKFLHLRDEHRQLQQKYNEAQDAIRRLNTMLQQIDNSLQKKAKLEATADGSIRRPVNRDTEALIKDMFDKNKALISTNKRLEAKNKQLTEQLEKKKRELQLAKKHALVRRNAAGPPASLNASRPLSAPQNSLRQSNNDEFAAVSHARLLEVSKRLQSRLKETEKTLEEVRHENAALRENSTLDARPSTGASLGERHEHIPIEARELQLRLKESQTQVHMLQRRYDALASQSDAQTHRHLDYEDQIHGYSSRIKELKNTLEELMHEKGVAEMKAARLQAADEELAELRTTNRMLEDKIKRLGEVPFISDAFHQNDVNSRLAVLEAERAEHVMKIQHLQEAARTHHSALVTLQQQASQLRDEKDAAIRQLEDMNIKYQQSETGNQLLNDRLRIYSGEDVDMQDLDRALTIVRRRTDAGNALNFLEPVDDNGPSDPSNSHLQLRRKLESIQVLNLNLTQENERLENMLKSQSAINRELQKELEDVLRRQAMDKGELLQTVNDLESIAAKRQHKVLQLEAQVRELMYSGKKKGKHSSDAAIDQTEVTDGDADDTLMEDLLLDGEYSAGDNLVEIWIQHAKLRDGVVTPGACTFATVDFFNFESQATSLVVGNDPAYDFAASFKITVDDLFLVYLATQTASFEVLQAVQGDFVTLGRCTIGMKDLLRHKPNFTKTAHLVGVRDSSVIGEVTVRVRMAMPIVELYRIFLERNPAQRDTIKRLQQQQAISNLPQDAVEEKEFLKQQLAVVNPEDESRLYNELEIRVVSASDIRFSKADPSSLETYVHFKLLGFPHSLTDVVVGGTAPEYDAEFTFPIITDDKQRQLLKKAQLVFNVINYRAGAEGKIPTLQDDGFIGEVTVPLAMLSEGQILSDEFIILDKLGKPAGKLRVHISWLYAFRTERQLSGHALSSADVAEVIKRFKHPNRDEFVDSVKFTRFVDPSVTALVALNKLANYVTDQRHGDADSSIHGVLSTFKPQSSDNFDVDAFLSALLPLEIGLASDDIVSLFEWLDIRAAGKVAFDVLVSAIELENTIQPILLAKLRQRAHAVRERGKTCVQLFVKLDSAGDGMLTERNFKEGLKAMGFDLVDEPVEDARASVDFLRLSGQQGEGLDSEFMSQAQRQGLRTDAAASRYDSLADDGDVLTSAEDLPFRTSRSQFDQQEAQRQAFDRRRKELQRRSEQRVAASAHTAPSTQLLRESSSSLTEPAVAQTFTVRDSGVRDLEEAHAHAAARILQSSYRDYRARRPPKIIASPVATPTAGRPPRHPMSARGSAQQPQQQALPDQQQTDAGTVPILVAEDALRSALDDLKSVRAPPDFMEWFGKMDQRNLGFVGKKQFFYVLSKYPELSLGPHNTKAFAEYFEHGLDEIDYHAFIRFVAYQPPQVPHFAKAIASMVFTPDTYFQFRSLDVVRSGALRPSAVIQVLHQLGYSQIPEASLRALCVAFELQADSDVDFANLFETVRCNELSQQYDSVRTLLQRAILSSVRQTGDMETGLRQWFARMDRAGLGKCSVEDLSVFLAALEIHAADPVTRALYRSLDRDKLGIHFADFKAFVLGRDTELPAFRVLSLVEQQHKAYTVMFDYAGRAQLDSVQNAFLLYDWSRKGFIGKSEFVRAALRCGFLFTQQEFRQLMSEFLWDDGVHVSYPAFLSWATPTSPDIARFSSVAHASGQAEQLIGSKLAEAHRRGVNLPALFRRYDRRATGKLSAADFCAALADIGISGLVVDEAIAYADRTRVLDGNQIRYLSVLSDLEQQAPQLVERAETPLHRLSQALTSGVGVEDFLRACQAYDLDGQGKVERQDLPRVLRKLRIELLVDDSDALADQFAVGAHEIDYRRMVEHLMKTTNRLTSSTRLTAVSGSTTGRSLLAGMDGKISSWIEALIQRGVDYRAELDSHDHEGHGAILSHEFRSGMQALNHPFEDRELVAIENAYKVRSQRRGGNAVDYVALLNEHHPKHRTADGFHSSGLALWKTSETLRLKIRRHCNYWMPGDLKGPFSHFDQQGEGVITFTGIVKGLGPSYLNMNVHPEQAKTLFDDMRLSNTNGVGYCEFVVFVCDPFHSDVADKFFGELARVGASSREVIRVCDDCDGHATGLLSMPQFLKAIRRLGLNLSTSDAERLVRRCDLEQTGLLSIALFTQLLRGSTAATTSSLEHMPASPSRAQPQEDLIREQFVLLRRAIRNKHDARYSLGEIWNLFDADRVGYLTTKGLLAGAKALGTVLQRTMVRPLLSHLESLAGAGGEVTRSNLLEVFGVQGSTLRNSTGSKMQDEEDQLGGRVRPPAHRVERALGRVHDLILEMPRTRRSYQRLNDSISRQYGTTIDWRQLQDFVHDLVPAASPADLRDIFDFLADRNGESIESSAVALELTPPSRLRLSEALEDRSHKRLSQTVLNSCQRASGQICDLRSELAPDEQKSILSVARANSFTLALEHIGCRLSMNDIRDLIDLMDPDNCGIVKYQEFVTFVEDNTDHNLRASRK